MTPIDLVKLTGGPGSIQLLLILTGIGLWLHYRRPRYRPIVRLALIVTALAYWILATPMTALAIEGWLPAPAATDVHDRFDTVVVLDGDNRRGRLAKSLAVWQQVAPKRLIVSGQDWLRDELIAAGVPQDKVEREGVTSNTREQIAWLQSLTSRESSGHVAVIASRLQAPRVSALVRRANIRTAILPAQIDAEPWSGGVWALVPSYSALRLSRDALYECAALKYYEFRGWIDPLAGAAERPSAAPRESAPRDGAVA